MNLRKVQKKYFDDHVAKGENLQSNEASKVINQIYKSYLKQTRAEVLSFFNVQPNDLLSPKIILRIYPLFFSPYSPFRQRYQHVNDTVDKIIKKIQFTGLIDELYDDFHPDAVTKIVDVKSGI